MKQIQELKKFQYILWECMGIEGWKPTGFDSLKNALVSQRYSIDFLITKNFDYEVSELINTICDPEN